MGKIFLDKLNTADATGGIQYRYELSNFQSITYDLNTPVSPMPLPEETAKDNILIKIEGNSGTISLRWKLVDNNGVNLAIPKVTIPAQDPIPSSTIREQLNFFRDLFAPESIDDKYRITVRLSDSTDFWHYQDVQYDGTFTQFSFTMSSPELLTFNASAKFLEGRVEDLFATDNPSAPPNVVATSPSNGRIDLTWGLPTELGSSTTVQYYTIDYKLYYTGDTPVEFNTSSSETSSRSASDISGSTNLATGVWEVRIAAKTAAGMGKISSSLVSVTGV
tara:strand:+ start:534 stop:1364 length:831 start_codon:yes stop_codon:yes gene_type:complete